MLRPERPTSSSRSDCSGGDFDWDVALRQLDELDARVENPSLWDKPAEAQTLMRERTRLAAQVEAVRSLERDLADAVGFAEMADAEGDEASLEDARAQLKALKARAGRAELEALLSGEADGNDAYVEINSGAGGTEFLRLGRDALAHVRPLGRRPRHERRGDRGDAGRTGRD